MTFVDCWCTCKTRIQPFRRHPVSFFGCVSRILPIANFSDRVLKGTDTRLKKSRSSQTWNHSKGEFHVFRIICTQSTKLELEGPSQRFHSHRTTSWTRAPYKSFRNFSFPLRVCVENKNLLHKRRCSHRFHANYRYVGDLGNGYFLKVQLMW